MMGMDGARRLMSRETSKPRRVGPTLRRLGGYFGAYGLMLAGVLVLIVYSTWAQVVIPGLLGQAVDCFIAVTPQSAQACTFTDSPGPDVAGLTRLVLVIVALYVSSAVVSGLMFYLMAWTGQHVLVRIRKAIFRRIHSLSLGYYTKHEAGDVMSRLTNDVDTIQQAMTFGLVQVTSGTLLIVWIVGTMLRDNVAYASLALAILPLMILSTVGLSQRARRAFRQTRIEMGSVSAGLQESISAVREVQAFSREDENIESFRRANAANRAANVRAVRYTSALGPSLEFLSFVSIAAVAGVGGIWALRGTPVFGTVFTLGLVVAFIGYVQRLNMPIQQIAVLWTNLQSAVAGAERIFDFLDEVPAVRDSPGAPPMPPIEGHVRFDGVWAEYDAGQPVLRGIDLEARPGQTIAIVGPTGAGKTTIISLLPRFWDVSAGRVTIDDIDVREVTQDSLHRQIGIVLQDTFLFSDTVLDNIRYGHPQATDEEVIAAARLVRADSFIDRLPQGYQTVLGERGSGLSQGQRQLIAIARAALVDPHLLILDEATSSVDTRTERLIQAALDRLMSGRTTFVIAHRLSTIRHADEVLYLDEGRIVERGTHQDLLARRGAYYTLYMSQFLTEAEGGAPAPAGPEVGRLELPVEPAGQPAAVASSAPLADRMSTLRGAKAVPSIAPMASAASGPAAARTTEDGTGVRAFGWRALAAVGISAALLSVTITLGVLAAINGGLRYRAEDRGGSSTQSEPADSGMPLAALSHLTGTLTAGDFASLAALVHPTDTLTAGDFASLAALVHPTGTLTAGDFASLAALVHPTDTLTAGATASPEPGGQAVATPSGGNSATRRSPLPPALAAAARAAPATTPVPGDLLWQDVLTPTAEAGDLLWQGVLEWSERWRSAAGAARMY